MRAGKEGGDEMIVLELIGLFISIMIFISELSLIIIAIKKKMPVTTIIYLVITLIFILLAIIELINPELINFTAFLFMEI